MLRSVALVPIIVPNPLESIASYILHLSQVIQIIRNDEVGGGVSGVVSLAKGGNLRSTQVACLIASNCVTTHCRLYFICCYLSIIVLLI